MKKRIAVICIMCISVIFFTSCSTQEKTAVTPEAGQAPTVESDSQKVHEDVEKIKNEAVPADFVEINAGNWKGKSVVITGEISALDKEAKLEAFPNCMISQVENDGYGDYLLLVPGGLENNTLENRGKGDIVTAYGTVAEPGSMGLPQILTVWIE